jgi:DNA-directed RNA polymerase specialized sigma24 family protein
MIPEASEQIRQALFASAKGDQHAFEDVCQWCSKWLTTYCRSRLRYEDLRASYEEDLHNEVLFHFWLELQRIPEPTALDCLNFWFILRRIAKSLAYDHYRARNCKKRRPANGFCSFECEQHYRAAQNDELLELEITEERDLILRSLSQHDQKLLELRRECIDIETIAKELKVGTSTLYNRLQEIEKSVKETFRESIITLLKSVG